MALKFCPIHMVATSRPWGWNDPCFLGSGWQISLCRRSCSIRQKLPLDSQMPTSWLNNSSTQAPCPWIASRYTNCIIDAFKKLSGLLFQGNCVKKRIFTKIYSLCDCNWYVCFYFHPHLWSPGNEKHFKCIRKELGFLFLLYNLQERTQDCCGWEVLRKKKPIQRWWNQSALFGKRPQNIW